MKYRVSWYFLSLFSITLYLFYGDLKPTKTLPIFNPSDVNPELVDSTEYISKYHTSATLFLNQNGRPSLKKDYEGKIYVADFSLPLAGHLSKMTANLFEVQKRLLIIRSDASFPYCVSK
jgi:protein SCO1/2